MTTAIKTRPSRRPVLGRLLLLLAALLVLVPLGLGMLMLETRPRVVAAGPPDAASARLTMDAAGRLLDFVQSEGAAGALTTSEAELNALLGSAGRVAPGLAGRARISADALALAVSARVPMLPGGLWANLSITLGPSTAGLRVTEARIGRLPVPPALVLPLARIALDWQLGDNLGRDGMAAITGLALDPPEATLRFDTTDGRVAAIFQRLRDRGLDAASAADIERVYVHLYWLHEAVPADAPDGTSALGFLRAAVSRADRLASKGAPADAADELRAALMALTLYCGEPDLGQAIGVTLPARMQGANNHCRDRTLDGRVDLRRHFTVSAGLQAASTGEAAFGIGELKELLDSNAGGSGFSFDDMAANVAGERFAQTFLAAPRADWAAMLDGVATEADILPVLDGLPSGLSEAEFRARYRDIDSPEYAALLAEIRHRVAALPLHQ